MKQHLPWSSDEDQRLRELAQSGLGLPEIAREMNRSKSAVRRNALKLQIAIASSPNGMTSFPIAGRRFKFRIGAKK